ncbi:MAG: hypothetical protein NTZ13_01210 [Candidatus Parcubacteria bacterium]|nr:hypothetical protein [Candidatus Parcubacteria bacterium]
MGKFWIDSHMPIVKVPDAVYEDGKVWINEYVPVSKPPDAVYEDGKVWLSSYASVVKVPDAVYDRESGGVAAAILLLLLSDGVEPNKEYGEDEEEIKEDGGGEESTTEYQQNTYTDTCESSYSYSPSVSSSSHPESKSGFMSKLPLFIFILLFVWVVVSNQSTKPTQKIQTTTISHTQQKNKISINDYSDDPKPTNQEKLNNTLGETIGYLHLTKQEKLNRIDTLIKNGADINGFGGKYGISPIESVIKTNDIQLLEEMISRGMKIKESKLCPAYTIGQNSFKPGSDIMLEALLKNGLQFNCLDRPPLFEFLDRGIKNSDYPTDQAVKIAKILIKNGANVNQKDYNGETILDRVDTMDGFFARHALKNTLTEKN